MTSPQGPVDRSRLDLASPQLRDTHSVPQAVLLDGGGRRRGRVVAGMDSTMGTGGDATAAGTGSGSPDAAAASVGDGQWSWGYSVLRFEASNPGLWPFHCHTALHAASGMAMVFQVGEI